MRIVSLVPFIALLGVTACDAAKVAELTGAKPPAAPAPAVCTPSPLPACAPAPGVTPAATTATDGRFAASGSANGGARANTAYAAPSKRHVHTHRAVRHTPAAKGGKVIVMPKKVYGPDTRYVTVDRPVYQPPQVIYAQPPRVEVYVDREIDRTSTAYGHQVYNRYARNPAPPVVYRGLYRQEQTVYSGVPQEGYAYQQRGPGYQTGLAYPPGVTYHQGGGADCNCGGTPAAGRDRDGHLTWPGKTERHQY